MHIFFSPFSIVTCVQFISFKIKYKKIMTTVL